MYLQNPDYKMILSSSSANVFVCACKLNMKGMHVARANTCIPNVFVCECVCVRDQNHLHKRTKLMIEMFNGNVISAPCVLGASSSSSHFSVSVARNG